MRRAAQIFVVSLLCIFATGANDVVGDMSKRYSKLGNGMMCTCGCNQVLLQCNHVGCSVSASMTQELKTMLQRGDNDEQVIAAFVAKYGETVLAAPTTTGFNRVAWVMPYLVFTLGLAGVAFLVRNWKLRPVAPPPPMMEAPSRELNDFRERARKETEI